jgi:hypothetical protein
MTEEQIESLAQEVLQDLQISDTTLRTKRHILSAIFRLEKTVIGRPLTDDLDPITNKNVRDYLLNYARYAYYGVIDEFKVNYIGLERELQIEAGI